MRPRDRSEWEERHRRRFEKRAARQADWELRWRVRHGQRPDWWPENEPWPPEGAYAWRKLRSRFFIRFAIGVSIVVLLVLAGPIVVISQVLGAAGLSGGAAVAGAVAIFLLVVFALLGAVRTARRFAMPVGHLIEATGRLEEGDLSARVPEFHHGPREVRALVSSFNSMAARLETDEMQRRTLLADVSHELRTPLAVLRGELEAMIDGIHPADEAHLTAAVDEIAMLTGLVEDLRTLTLAEAGTLALHPESTDVAVLAGEVAASFESLAAKSNVRLTVRASDDLPLVELDPLRIRQVLGNLVANALRYAPAGSEVLIAAESSPERAGGPAPVGRVTLAVVDHGPGISPEVLPHLFDRFAKSAESRGSGLGLAIARRLVEAHGGTIRAELPPEGGTIVRFELPVDAAAGPAARQPFEP